VTLVVQHAMRMHRTILSNAACPAVQYFSTFSHKGQDFPNTSIEHKTCVLISLQLLSETFLIISRLD